MKPEGLEVVRRAVREAVRAAKAAHPRDPAAQERHLRAAGWGKIADAREEGRREERERVRACFALAEDQTAPVATWIEERALSADRPEPDELARALVRARGDGRLPVVVEGW